MIISRLSEPLKPLQIYYFRIVYRLPLTDIFHNGWIGESSLYLETLLLTRMTPVGSPNSSIPNFCGLLILDIISGQYISEDSC